jgi:hypothetical protein
VEQPGIEELRAELRASARRRDATIAGAVTLLGGIVWLAVSFNPWPGVVLVAAGAIALDSRASDHLSSIQVAVALAQSSPSSSKIAVPA